MVVFYDGFLFGSCLSDLVLFFWSVWRVYSSLCNFNCLPGFVNLVGLFVLLLFFCTYPFIGLKSWLGNNVIFASHWNTKCNHILSLIELMLWFYESKKTSKVWFTKQDKSSWVQIFYLVILATNPSPVNVMVHNRMMEISNILYGWPWIGIW